MWVLKHVDKDLFITRANVTGASVGVTDNLQKAKCFPLKGSTKRILNSELQKERLRAKGHFLDNFVAKEVLVVIA